MAGPFPIFSPPSSPFFQPIRQPDYSAGIGQGIAGIGQAITGNRDYAAKLAEQADLNAYRADEQRTQQGRNEIAKGALGADLLKQGYRIKPGGAGASDIEPIPGYTEPADAPKITAINSIRKEYLDQPGVSNYNKSAAKVRDMIGQLDVDTAVSDMAFIYAMAQIYDPNSTVREGELQMAQGSQSLIDQLKGMYKKAWSGERALDRTTRSAFIRAANGRIKEYKADADKEAAYYADLARRNNIDPRDVVRPTSDLPDLTTLGPEPIPTGTPGAPGAPAPPVPPGATPPQPPGR